MADDSDDNNDDADDDADDDISSVGVGCGMIIVSSLVALYYNMIIAWTCFYMFASFTTELPWERCHLEWSTHGKPIERLK